MKQKMSIQSYLDATYDFIINNPDLFPQEDLLFIVCPKCDYPVSYEQLAASDTLVCQDCGYVFEKQTS